MFDRLKQLFSVKGNPVHVRPTEGYRDVTRNDTRIARLRIAIAGLEAEKFTGPELDELRDELKKREALNG